MKCVVYHGPGNVRCEERVARHPGPGEVLLRVMAAGLCGTDRHIYHGEYDAAPPVVIGHEFAGQVVALGEERLGLSVGDRVTIDPARPCGVCRPCRRGAYHNCQDRRALGVHLDGGFAEYCVAPARQCLALPEGISYAEGAIMEPLACCVHGIDRAEVVAGDVVAVIGAGAIGLMMLQLARLRGAARVMVSEPNAARRAMALELGADEAFDPRQGDPLASDGPLAEGADVVIEAVGAAATARQAVAWAAPGGRVLWFGVASPGEVVPVEPNLVFAKELTLLGARLSPFTHARAVDLVASRQVRIAPLITRLIDLEALPGVLRDPQGDEIKTVVLPNG